MGAKRPTVDPANEVQIQLRWYPMNPRDVICVGSALTSTNDKCNNSPQHLRISAQREPVGSRSSDAKFARIFPAKLHLLPGLVASPGHDFCSLRTAGTRWTGVDLVLFWVRKWKTADCTAVFKSSIPRGDRK